LPNPAGHEYLVLFSSAFVEPFLRLVQCNIRGKNITIT
jgi:hypothetical protein